MGLFNVLQVSDRCSFCCVRQRMEIQFKYGELGQYRYCLGDAIRADPGSAPFDESQVVRGSVSCGVCDTRYILCEVHFRRNVIVRVAVLPALESVFPLVTKGVRGKHGHGKRTKGSRPSK